MELDKLFLERRSMRSYDETKQVSNETIEELLKAAKLSPSWKNSQTARYYVVSSPEKLEKVRSMGLPEFNQKNSKGAVLLVTTYVKNIAGFMPDGSANNEVGNGWGAYDLGIQAGYLVLKAKDMGLDTLIMGIRNAEALRAELNIPESEEVMAVISLGYGNGKAVLYDRKPLEETVKFF